LHKGLLQVIFAAGDGLPVVADVGAPNQQHFLRSAVNDDQYRLWDLEGRL
jgi:hypothetical protein